MNEPNASPLVVPLLFLLRCMVPLLVLLGISYLLKKLGFIAEPPQPPPGYTNGDSGQNDLNGEEGGLAHGKS
jgi:hypothetical protein